MNNEQQVFELSGITAAQHSDDVLQTPISGSDDGKPWSTERAQKLRHLQATLDALIYVELAILYYLDNLTLLFLLRSTFQRLVVISLSIPRALQRTNLPLPLGYALSRTNNSKTHLLMLLGVTLLSMTVHLLLAPPTASELTRGYLQGGLLIDFVGQKAAGAWRSRFRMMAVDFLVAVLQIILFAVMKESTRCESMLGSSSPNIDADRLLSFVMQRRNALDVSDANENLTGPRGGGGPEEPNDRGTREEEAPNSRDGGASDGQPDDPPSTAASEPRSSILIVIDPLKVLQDCFWELRHRNPGAV